MTERPADIHHPVLGQLRWIKNTGWCGKVRLGQWGQKRWEVSVYLGEVEREEIDRPAALAVPVVEAGPSLGQTLRRGVWDEFTGAEPQGRYWWSGQLDQVNSLFEKPLSGPDDLIDHLDPHTLFVTEDFHGDEQLVAGFHCSCDFEEEHGLDILTDGQRVLGTGYSGEARKYERFSKLTDAEISARSDAMWAKMDRRHGQGD